MSRAKSQALRKHGESSGQQSQLHDHRIFEASETRVLAGLQQPRRKLLGIPAQAQQVLKTYPAYPLQKTANMATGKSALGHPEDSKPHRLTMPKLLDPNTIWSSCLDLGSAMFVNTLPAKMELPFAS